MRVPEAIFEYDYENRLTCKILGRVNDNFGLFIENYIRNFVNNPVTLVTINIIKQKFRAEMVRLISSGLLSLDQDNIWEMSHIEDLSNFEIKDIYRRKLV